MTDQVNPGTSAPGAGDPGTSGPSLQTQQPPSQIVDWESRYKGMVRANSEKDQQIQALSAKAGELEQQIAALLGEKDTLKVTWETKFNQASQDFLKLKSEKDSGDKAYQDTLAELAKLQALSQHPELMVYADLIQPTTDAPALEAQIARVQQIHANTLDQARKGLQQQGFAPPAAPPATSQAVTVESLAKELQRARDALMRGELTQTQFSEETSRIGDQYNLLVRSSGGH